MKVTLTIPDAQIENVLESASSTDWARIIRYEVAKTLKGHDAIVLEDWGDENESQGRHRVTKSSIAKGIAILAEKYPHLFEQIINENTTDMYSGDYLLQCAVFGELKYS
jgi:hypothetical protein